MTAFSQHAVTAIALSSDGARLATVGDQDCSTLLVSSLPPVTKERQYLTRSSNCVATKTASLTALAWNGSNRVYTADSRGALAAYSYGEQGLIRVSNIVAAHSGHPLTGVAVSPSLVASTGKDGLVKAWDMERACCIARMKGHKGEARAVAVGDVGEFHLFASAGRDRTVRLWDVRVGSAGMPIGVLSGHEGWVHDVAMCGGNRPRVVSCAGDKTVRVWDLASRQIESIKSGHEFRVWSVAVDPEGTFAVSGSTDTSVRYWKLDGGDGDSVWEEHQDSVLAVAVARDASFAVSASENGTVVMWDVKRMTNASMHLDDTLHEINLEQPSELQLSQRHSPSTLGPLSPSSPKQKLNRNSNFFTPPHVLPDEPVSNQNTTADTSHVSNRTHLYTPPSRETRPPLNPVAASPSRQIHAQILHAPLSNSSPSSHLHQSPTLSTSASTHLPASTSMMQYEHPPLPIPVTPPPRPITSTPPRTASTSIPSTPPRTNGRIRSPSSEHEARSSASVDSSPRRRRRDEDEAAVARIRKLEQMIAVRDKQILAHDARVQGLEHAIRQRDRDIQLMKKQVESAENLAKQANVRALAAESASVSGSILDDSTDEAVDYTESIDRISRVTGKLKALAAKLDGLDIV